MQKNRLYSILFFILLLVNPIFGVDQRIPMRKISGQVTDEMDMPLIGANIFIAEMKRIGTATDVNGNFSLMIPDKDVVLTFTYIGMKMRMIKLVNQTELKVKLESDDTQIEEVVVRGAYGNIQKRSDMVGSAFQVNAKDIRHLAPSRIDNILDGLVPGLKITPMSDSPQSRTRYTTRLRGDGSLSASSEPMWIIDGVPAYTGGTTNMVAGMSYTVSPLSFLNPDDIESITVLKDASTTAIYGVNASNGVILVVTKSGRGGKRTFNASVRYGISKIDESTRFKTLNSAQYLELAHEAWNNAGNSDLSLFPYTDNELNSYSTTDTDWQDHFFEVGSNMLVNISASGGSNSISNRISASYYNEKATAKGNSQQRITLSSNTNIELNKKLRAKIILDASYNENKITPAQRDYYENLPIFTPYDEDGYSMRLWNKYIDGSTTDGTGNIIPVWKERKFINYVAEREENSNVQRGVGIGGNASLTYEIIDGLSATAQFGAKYINNQEAIYSAKTNWSGISNGEPLGYSRRASANVLTWTNVERLNFNKTYGLHGVSAILGIEFKNASNDNLSAVGSGFMNDNIQEISYSEEDSRNAWSNSDISRNMSYFISGSYNFNRRYYLTVTGRKDGSSDFGEYVRWAKSGSAGVSWNIHNENFFKSKTINVLKLKMSYGTTNNSRSNAEASGSYSYGSSTYYMGQLGATMSSPPNPGLTWEVTTKTNIGVRTQFWERLDVDIEYYNNRTSDLLSKLDVSRIVGESRMWRNAGEMRNRGVEFNITSKNIRGKDFKWTTNFNIAQNRNKIIDLFNETSTSFTTSIWTEGESKNTFYLVKWAGVDPSDGSPLWYDKEGNVTKTFSQDNRVPDKTTTPDFHGGMQNTFIWKNLTLSVNLNYSIGGYALSSLVRSTLDDGLGIFDNNQMVETLDRWQKPGDMSMNPKNVYMNSSQSSMYSTRHLYKATHFRLQNVALSYDLPQEISSKLNLRHCNISLIGDNIALWTPDQKKGQNSYKTIMGAFPTTSSYSIVINVNF